MPTEQEIQRERERRARRQRSNADARGPTRQAIAAERERRAAARAAARPGALEDVARSAVTGLREGIGWALGQGGDLRDLSRAATEFGARLGGADPERARAISRTQDAVREAVAPVALGPMGVGVNAALRAPSSADVQAADEAIFGERYEPQTTAGEYARTIASFAPSAAAPGSRATRVARVVLPGVASETAGQATEGTPLEGPARFVAGLAGGIGAEAGVASSARRAARLAPQIEAQGLERRFGPLTAGERSASPQARLQEDDFRRGIGSDQAQSIMRGFDARRAQAIRENAMSIVTRGQQALSANVGEAGTILSDELRSARTRLRQLASEQYNEAFELAGQEAIPQGLNEMPSVRVAAAADEFRFDVPPPAQRAIAQLENEIQQGAGSHAAVERTRQALNRELGAAANARDDAREFVYARIISALDDWQDGLIRNPEAQRAMREARGIFSEAQSLFTPQARVALADGAVGRTDLGGRAVDRAINSDLTGEQIIDAILGSGTRPSAQALGAVRRIRQLGTRTIITSRKGAESGVRAPGRVSLGDSNLDQLDMRVKGSQRFVADDPAGPYGQQQPSAELQALREGLWHRILRPMDDYLTRVDDVGGREGGLLPAQRMITQLDNALNKSGREIMDVLFTERELGEMRQFLAYLRRLVPPAGSGVSGTPAGVYRMIAGAFDKLAGLIPGLGPVLREIVSEANSTGAARRAVAPPRPITAPPATVEQPSLVGPAVVGANAAQIEAQRWREGIDASERSRRGR